MSETQYFHHNAGMGAMYGDLYEKGLTAITVGVRRNAPEAMPRTSNH